MLNDIERHLGAVERRDFSLERDGVPARAVVLSRLYETTVDDLWDAVTNKERLPRWFAAVEGDLQIGGRYQVENNAGGEIAQCEPPRMFSLTWEFGGDVSWVDVELKAEIPKMARLTLTHTAKMSPHLGAVRPWRCRRRVGTRSIGLGTLSYRLRGEQTGRGSIRSQRRRESVHAGKQRKVGRGGDQRRRRSRKSPRIRVTYRGFL